MGETEGPGEVNQLVPAVERGCNRGDGNSALSDFSKYSAKTKQNKQTSEYFNCILFVQGFSFYLFFFFFYVKHWWSENGFLCALHFDLSPKDGDRTQFLQEELPHRLGFAGELLAKGP